MDAPQWREHHNKVMSAPAPATAYGGFPADGLQALMSENWSSPPNRLLFSATTTAATATATGTGYHSSFPHDIPGIPSHLPIPALPFAFPGAGPEPDPEQFSGGGFGFASAASGSALLVSAGTAPAAPLRSVGNVDFTSTSTSTPTPTPTPPTPRQFSTLAGLARQQDQALAALHSTFASPHYFNTTSFGAHLPDVHQRNPHLPNANGFFDQFATADFSPPPNFLQPPFLSPLHQRACELHVVPQFLRPAAGPSPLPFSTSTPLQFGYYLEVPDLEVEGLAQRRDLEDRPHNEDNSRAVELRAQDHREDDGVQDEQGRIAVDSLLDDNMPVKKRTRAASSLDEPAGPATIKRPRSQNGGASVSSRRQIKPRRTVPTVVIPDSDDIFAEEDDGKQEMFDLTENDNLPEEHKMVKEDASTKLCKFECSICLDTASSLTVTYCGHMYCGPCLHQALHAEVTKRICPMCRQKIDVRPKNAQPAKMSKTFFHLEMKLKPSKRQGKQPIRPVRRV